MNAVWETLEKIGIVPVVRIDDPERAVPLAGALAAGGIPCAEITFRTAHGAEAIRRISGEAPGTLVGAGTVLTPAQVDLAVEAGARFVVSPGLNPRVVERCLEKGIPVAPGCSSPSDIERAIELGLDVVKFFPAEQSGGLDFIRAVAAPYPGIRFMPTGGIGAGNIARYIAFDRVLACGGSWMVPADKIAADDMEGITALSRGAMLAMLAFAVDHLGIAPDSACAQAGFLGNLLGFPTVPADGGRIVISTNCLPRAVAYLERGGASFDHDSAERDSGGRLAAIRLKGEVFGLSVHIRQK